MNKYEITVLNLSAVHPGFADRCTLTAASVNDAAQQYAALFDPKGEKHQGLASYPTWTVAVWLDNSAGHSLAVHRRRLLLLSSPHEEYPEVRMAEWLREYVEDSFMRDGVRLACDNSGSVAGSFLSHVMNLVDWMELSRRYMKRD